jgi:hypothetical protein|tara:strand:+ start:1446 stop:1589 length:144 start_codon:yes stop_codon:yes gene_type:complete
MTDLYNRYKQIKVVDPKLKDVSFNDWKLKLGLEAWERARSKSYKKNK